MYFITELKETYLEGKDLITEKKLEIAQKYIDCPQIHIPWFKAIYEDQEERTNYLEAGIAIVHIINFIYSSIKGTISATVASDAMVKYFKEFSTPSIA